MPKSSRHKSSHKQSKHSSKDLLLSDSEEDVKVKERSNAKEVVSSVRVSIESSHEKRRISSSFQSKEVKDLSLSEEYLSSKVRKDKAERVSGSGGGDRWKAGGDEENGSKEMEGQKSKLDSEKGLKSSRESKGLSDVKSKSSRRHESSGVVEEDRDVSLVLKGGGKEEENRSGSTRYDSKRKSDKDSSRREGRESRDTKEKEKEKDKERVSDRESKKIVEKKPESVAQVDVGSVTKKKRDSLLEDVDKDRLVKRGKENTELGVVDKSRYPESEKEVEKTIHRKTEGSSGRDRYRDAKENDQKKGDAVKDGKYKDERYKSGNNHREKLQDNIDKDDKYREDAGGERDSSTRRRDEKHLDGSEREQRREDKDRHRDDGDRENKHRDDKYHEGGGKDKQRYYEDSERVVVVGVKDEKHRVKNDRHNKEEKFREDHEKEDNELRDKEKRGVRVVKYNKDDRSLRDRDRDRDRPGGDKSRDDTFSSRKPSIHDNSTTSYDERSRLKGGGQGRKRTSDKDDYIELKPRGFKDQRYDVEKRSGSDARVEIVTNRGRSGSRYTDGNRHSPSSSSHATRDQYRLIKQDDLKYNIENAYEERVGHSITSTREHGDNAEKKNSLSRSNGVIPKDDDDDVMMKSDTRNLVSSPNRRNNNGRSDFRRSDDIEESVQRRGTTRDLGSETEPSSLVVDENSKSPYPPRNTNLLSNSRSFSHPFPSPSPFRSVDRHHHNNNNNNNRRNNGDPNMVVVRSPWKGGGLPNWPSHLANGFMPPFPHGPPPPPPVGFHPTMQPFPGMRPPSMDLNHYHHHPYPIPDWRTPRPPPPHPHQLNGWEQQWQHHGGPWNSKPVASLEQLPFAFEKDLHNNNNNLEEGGPTLSSHYQSNEQAKKDELTLYDVKSQTSDKDHVASEEVAVEEKTSNDVSRKLTEETNEEVFCRAYFSVLDVSADLTDPELYSRYKDVVVNVAEEMMSDSEDDKILYVEVSKPKVMSTNETSSFPAIGDSLLQKAMSLYNKHRQGFMMKEKHSPPEKVKSPIEEIHPDTSMDVENSGDVKVNSVPMENTAEESPGGTEVIGSGSSLTDSEISKKEESLGGGDGENGSMDVSLNVVVAVSNKAAKEEEVVDDDEVVVVVGGELKSDDESVLKILHSPESTH